MFAALSVAAGECGLPAVLANARLMNCLSSYVFTFAAAVVQAAFASAGRIALSASREEITAGFQFLTLGVLATHFPNVADPMRRKFSSVTQEAWDELAKAGCASKFRGTWSFLSSFRKEMLKADTLSALLDDAQPVFELMKKLAIGGAIGAQLVQVARNEPSALIISVRESWASLQNEFGCLLEAVFWHLARGHPLRSQASAMLGAEFVSGNVEAVQRLFDQKHTGDTALLALLRDWTGKPLLQVDAATLADHRAAVLIQLKRKEAAKAKSKVSESKAPKVSAAFSALVASLETKAKTSLAAVRELELLTTGALISDAVATNAAYKKAGIPLTVAAGDVVVYTGIAPTGPRMQALVHLHSPFEIIRVGGGREKVAYSGRMPRLGVPEMRRLHPPLPL